MNTHSPSFTIGYLIKRTWLLLLTGLALIGQAQEVRIESLSRGVLTWTNAHLYGTCRIEWAPSVEGPWYDSWAPLTNLVVTNRLMSVQVPMFYRVVCEPPPEPVFTNVSAGAAVTLIQDNSDEPEFVILDVRTPTEFAPAHIVGAINIDFRDSSFTASVGALDRTRRYLVYCASGGRSAMAMEVLRNLGFLEVYNMLGGFGLFSTLPEAQPLIEP